MNNPNENIKIKVFAAGKKQKTYDQRDEGLIVNTIRQHVLPRAKADYHSVKVKVKRKGDQSPEYLIAYMLRKDTYTADVWRVDVDDNFDLQTIKEDYDDSSDYDDEEDNEEEGATYAPGESFDFIAATPVPEIESAKQAVEMAHRIAVDCGLKSKILLGTDATVGNYKHHLASGLKGFVNVGHGYTGGIILEDGRLRSTWFLGLSGKPIAPAVVYFNSCQVFNPPLQPAVMHAGARTYIGGIVNLLIGPSEEVCKCFWTKSLTQGERMGDALHSCERAHYPTQGAHGISGDMGLFEAKHTIGLRACNQRFVCAQNGGGRDLIANRTWIRSWETFTLVKLGHNKVALRAPNGKYVCAEGGGGRELVANRDWIRSWETFVLHELGDNRIALQACNGQYVCAENGGRSHLMANRNWIRSWETFDLIGLKRIGLQANNSKYVCAEGGGGRELVANRDWLRSWETFVLTDLGNGKVALMAKNGQYVCAEDGGNRPLVANRNWIRGWEIFTLRNLGHKVALQACNGKFVCASGTQDLIARSAQIGGEESFVQIDL